MLWLSEIDMLINMLKKGMSKNTAILFLYMYHRSGLALDWPKGYPIEDLLEDWGCKTDNKWIYIRVSKIENDLKFTAIERRKAWKDLKKRRLIETSHRGLPALTYFRFRKQTCMNYICSPQRETTK